MSITDLSGKSKHGTWMAKKCKAHELHILSTPNRHKFFLFSFNPSVVLEKNITIKHWQDLTKYSFWATTLVWKLQPQQLAFPISSSKKVRHWGYLWRSCILPQRKMETEVGRGTLYSWFGPGLTNHYLQAEFNKRIAIDLFLSLAHSWLRDIDTSAP